MGRNTLVDKLKGYACFLVLFGHVIMGIRLAGINIPSFFEGVEKFIWSFHVALFFFLSGVVYKETGEWTRKKTKLKFILHKLYSLGIPYVVFSVVYIVINSVVGQANNQSSLIDVLYIWRTPIAQYWFLYALFFLFCIYAACSGILPNWATTLVVVLIAYIVPLFGGGSGSFEVVFYSALAFGLGASVRFADLLKPAVWVKWSAIGSHTAVAVCLIIMGKIETIYIKEVMQVYGIYASISLISLLQNSKLISKFLTFINQYSFQIYLLHTIFTAGCRIMLVRMNITQWWIHVLVGTACGIVFSVFAAVIAEKVRFLNFFFFPSKVSKSKECIKKA